MSLLTTKCPHCTADPRPLNVSDIERQPGTGMPIIFCVCPRCNMPISALLRSGGRATVTEDWFYTHGTQKNVDLLSATGWEIHAIFPQITDKGAPEHCPPEVDRIFRQAVSTHLRAEFDAAG